MTDILPQADHNPAPEPAADAASDATSTTASTTGAQPHKHRPLRLLFRGTAGESFSTLGLNLLLSLASLGLYAPWALGTARTYLYGRLSLNKKYIFAYKNNPVEFAVGLGVLAVATIILLSLFHVAQTHGLSFLTFLVMLAAYALFYACVYASFYIRLRHISLHGRNFVPKPDVLGYTLLAVKRGFINLVTIGFKIPESDRLKWKFMVSNLSYSGGAFSSDMSASQARKTGMANMVSLWLPLLTVTVLVLTLVSLPPEAQAQGRGNLLTFLILLVTGLGFLGRTTYRAAMWDLRLSTLRLGPIRFRNTLDEKNVFRLQLTNALLFFFTAGLAYPYILHRKMEFYSEAILVSGDAEALLET